MKTPNQQVLNFIERANNILCLTQEKPTKDGAAGLLAFQVLLDSLKKKSTLVCHGSLSEKLRFLPGYTFVTTEIPGSNELSIRIKNIVNTDISTKSTDFTEITLKPQNGKLDPKDIEIVPKMADFDLIVVIDSPDLESLGSVFTDQAELFSQVPIIQISADPSHDVFGRVSLYEPEKSSACEIIANLFTNLTLTPEQKETLSTILLTGIVSATGSFLQKNTTPSALESASKLQQDGARQSDIIENLFKKKSLKTLKLWGKILSQLEVDPVHKIAWSVLTKNDFNTTKATIYDIDDVTDNLLRFTYGSEICTLICETNENTFVQIRTNNPGINMLDLQKEFGGSTVKDGLDMTLNNQSASVVKEKLLSLLAQFQETRLNLTPDTPVVAQTITMKKETATPLDFKMTSKPKAGTPTAPKEIPFRKV